jgi:purine-binding chemotaxis protein CheW
MTPRSLPSDPHAAAVLARRARQLAASGDTAAPMTSPRHYLRARLAGGGWFGIPRDCAREVITPNGMAAVPGVPAHIAGVVSVRGDMITVLDLPAWFRIGRTARERAEAVLIVETQGMTAGVLIEELSGEFACDLAAVAAAPEGAAIPAKFVTGIHDGTITLLDIAAIMADPEIIVSN